jgi:hypothetical protein
VLDQILNFKDQFMNQINSFPVNIHEKVDYYVYRLFDPRTAETFYVGKGKGDRVFQHAKGALKFNQEEKEKEEGKGEDEISSKIKQIRDIQNAGLEVGYIIHRHGMDEPTALEVEAALIDAYPHLTNEMNGHGSSGRGIMHIQKIINKYHAETADFAHYNILMINVNKSTSLESKEIYDAVRYAWVVDKNKADNADYILAVKQGLIIGVFVAKEWLPALRKNFPGLPEDMPKRKGFNGGKANDEIWNKYVKKLSQKNIVKKAQPTPLNIRIEYNKLKNFLTTKTPRRKEFFDIASCFLVSSCLDFLCFYIFFIRASISAGLPAFKVSISLSIRRTRPESTLPAPSSTACSTPCSFIQSTDSRQRTVPVTCSTNRRLISAASRTALAVTLATTGTRSGVMVVAAKASSMARAAGSIRRQ